MLLVSAQVVIGLAGGIYEDVSGLLVIRAWSLTFADGESSLCDKSNVLPAEPRKAGVEPVWFVDSEDVKEYTNLGLKARHISTPGVHWNKITCAAQTRELLLRFRGPCVPGRRAIKFGWRPTKDPTLLCVNHLEQLCLPGAGGRRRQACCRPQQSFRGPHARERGRLSARCCSPCAIHQTYAALHFIFSLALPIRLRKLPVLGKLAASAATTLADAWLLSSKLRRVMVLWQAIVS